jgi:hypothetical protein
MQKITSLIVILFALALTGGCATMQQGNYLPDTADQQRLANESVKQLATLYPPATTRLEIMQSADDPFGIALIEALRNSGYAVQEDVEQSSEEMEASRNKQLRYLVDVIGPEQYRVALYIGEVSITRPYQQAENGELIPAGYWIRKE